MPLNDHQRRCMVIFSLSNPRIGTPICAPPFGKINNNVDLETLGLANEDPAGYGFGFNSQNTQDSLVQPDFYVSLSWKPEVKEVVYNSCFYKPFGLFREHLT